MTSKSYYFSCSVIAVQWSQMVYIQHIYDIFQICKGISLFLEWGERDRVVKVLDSGAHGSGFETNLRRLALCVPGQGNCSVVWRSCKAVGPIWSTFHTLPDVKVHHGLFEKSTGIPTGTIDCMSKYVTASWTTVGKGVCSLIKSPAVIVNTTSSGVKIWSRDLARISKLPVFLYRSARPKLSSMAKIT